MRIRITCSIVQWHVYFIKRAIQPHSHDSRANVSATDVLTKFGLIIVLNINIISATFTYSLHLYPPYFLFQTSFNFLIHCRKKPVTHKASPTSEPRTINITTQVIEFIKMNPRDTNLPI